MRTSSTKSALLTSSIALLLCFTMLLGTTFAWFTDSVTSANNIIKSGNLDVTFEYWNGTGWATVEDASDILINELWEPGVTEVAYLKVANAGSLALKYQLGINIVSEKMGVNVANEEFKLSDYLYFGVIEGAKENAYANRADAVAAVTNAQLISAGYTKEATIEAGSADNYFALVVYMPETVDNVANHNGTDVPEIALGLNVAATQLAAEEDSFDETYDESALLPDVTVFSSADLQNALDEAKVGETTVIALAYDVTEDIELTRKADTNIVIDGNGKSVAGAITFDGKSATIASGNVVVQNVNFTGENIPADVDACVRLGDGTNATRYVCNVTVKNCTFDAPGKVGVKSYTGGDKNISIIGCTATANAHSLAQLKGVDGVVVENCKVYSKNGINFNNSTNVTVKDCTVDTKGYSVRFGESSGGSGAAETYLIENCSLKSACDDGDAVIVIRGSADYSTLTLKNTTLDGAVEIANTATDAKVIEL